MKRGQTAIGGCMRGDKTRSRTTRRGCESGGVRLPEYEMWQALLHRRDGVRIRAQQRQRDGLGFVARSAGRRSVPVRDACANTARRGARLLADQLLLVHAARLPWHRAPVHHVKIGHHDTARSLQFRSVGLFDDVQEASAALNDRSRAGPHGGRLI